MHKDILKFWDHRMLFELLSLLPFWKNPPKEKNYRDIVDPKKKFVLGSFFWLDPPLLKTCESFSCHTVLFYWIYRDDDSNDLGVFAVSRLLYFCLLMISFVIILVYLSLSYYIYICTTGVNPFVGILCNYLFYFIKWKHKLDCACPKCNNPIIKTRCMYAPQVVLDRISICF